VSGRYQKQEVILVGDSIVSGLWPRIEVKSVSSVHLGPHTSLRGDVSQDWNGTGTQWLNLRGQNLLPMLTHSFALLLF